MSSMHTLMAVLAHPDDESLGFGGTLAKYAAEGASVSLVTATRGERGRFHRTRAGDEGHPGERRLGELRAAELQAAASALGATDVSILNYGDQQLDRADPRRIVPDLARHVRRVRPDVVLTFGPDGAYGHPDHIAISQFTAAALVAAADPAFDAGESGSAPHAVSKLYFLAWPSAAWTAYEQAFKKLVSNVDGIERQVVPWPDWAITTVLDTRSVSDRVWRAVQAHASQVSGYSGLQDLGRDARDDLFGRQYFYRVFSTVNAGRVQETCLFEGIAR